MVKIWDLMLSSTILSSFSVPWRPLRFPLGQPCYHEREHRYFTQVPVGFDHNSASLQVCYRSETMTTTEQAVREENIRAIVSFFESGVERCSQRLGVELEHTLVHADGSPVSYTRAAWRALASRRPERRLPRGHLR